MTTSTTTELERRLREQAAETYRVLVKRLADGSVKVADVAADVRQAMDTLGFDGEELDADVAMLRKRDALRAKLERFESERAPELQRQAEALAPLRGAATRAWAEYSEARGRLNEAREKIDKEWEQHRTLTRQLGGIEKRLGRVLSEDDG